MMTLDQQILKMLGARAVRDRPLTIGDLARESGANPQVVATAARRLVDGGLAAPSMVVVHGVPTLHGLLPQPPAEVGA